MQALRTCKILRDLGRVGNNTRMAGGKNLTFFKEGHPIVLCTLVWPQRDKTPAPRQQPPTKCTRAQPQTQATEGVMVAIKALCQRMTYMEDLMGTAMPPTVPEPPPSMVMEQGPQGVQAREDSSDEMIIIFAQGASRSDGSTQQQGSPDVFSTINSASRPDFSSTSHSSSYDGCVGRR